MQSLLVIRRIVECLLLLMANNVNNSLKDTQSREVDLVQKFLPRKFHDFHKIFLIEACAEREQKNKNKRSYLRHVMLTATNLSLGCYGKQSLFSSNNLHRPDGAKGLAWLRKLHFCAFDPAQLAAVVMTPTENCSTAAPGYRPIRRASKNRGKLELVPIPHKI